MLIGYRNFDCGRKSFIFQELSEWMCNLLLTYPQDWVFDIYSCLNDKKVIQIDPDNKVEKDI